MTGYTALASKKMKSVCAIIHRKNLSFTAREQPISNSVSRLAGVNSGVLRISTDYDLTQHQNSIRTGSVLTLMTTKNEKYIPYVIEPSLGADRVVLAFLCCAYDEEEYRNRGKTGYAYCTAFPSGACSGQDRCASAFQEIK